MKDMMKRLSQPVQGFKPHSQMLTSLVCSEKKQRTTEGGLSLTYIILINSFSKHLKNIYS